ncbi:hypothetical protein MKJ04_16655 [Pontibacter sp. E15-1]|uniref:hypothetical protein n=1 Tax=Pontibacter sp. E15-1 TaxID=2919918 RepID=UPI001F4FAD15|nr:hypothetical protein [Pontibacter sp. E15-1]MCJ8166478.1 hypothetical protein [Pontibacter sp. E15-1]
MKRIDVYIAGITLAGLVGCTSLSEGQESLPGNGSGNERVTLRADPSESLREKMDEQSSEINRKRNIEEFNQNLPATTPNALRPQQLPHAPVDTVQHNVTRPVRPTVPPPPADN